MVAVDEVVTQPLHKVHNRVPDKGGHSLADLGSGQAVVGRGEGPAPGPLTMCIRPSRPGPRNRSPLEGSGDTYLRKTQWSRDTVVFKYSMGKAYKRGRDFRQEWY